jgi:hypothetical protein
VWNSDSVITNDYEYRITFRVVSHSDLNSSGESSHLQRVCNQIIEALPERLPIRYNEGITTNLELYRHILSIETKEVVPHLLR